MWFPSPSNWGIRHLLNFFFTLRSRVWSIESLIEQYNIDIVYSNGLPCIDGAIAAKKTGRPHIWHLRETIRNNHDLRRYLPARLVEEIIAWLSDIVIVNSSFLADHLMAQRLRRKTRVIYNGININSIATVPANIRQLVREELGISQNTHIVLAVGTIARTKGYDTLVRAAHRVLSLAPDTVFLVAGAELADYTPRIVELITRLGLDDSIRLLGPRSDIPSLMSAADMLVHSARHEAFGRVLVEAMAASKPVISTRCGGPEEIVLDGETGILVPSDDVAAMTDAIVRLLMDQGLALRMGTQGRLRAASEFSVEAYSENIARTIESVVGEKSNLAEKETVER
jgi:glycosyltransferase involved in cell wall biosynthesis